MSNGTKDRAPGREVAPAEGKLGVMLVGLGAVSTTFIAGVESVRRGFPWMSLEACRHFYGQLA